MLAAVLVGAELLTGTFYLLAVGVAFALGGIAALLGARLRCSSLVAGVLGVVGAIAGPPLANRARHAAAAAGARHRPGGAWSGKPGPDGTARVAYRGTQWDAELATPGAPRAETMYIVRHERARSCSSPRAARARTGAYPLIILNRRRRPRYVDRFVVVHVALFVVAIIVIIKTIRVVPQQHALGRRAARALLRGAGARPQFRDSVRRPRRVSSHDLREIPLDVPSQICITRDNTQLQVDGILYFQVTDPEARVVRLVSNFMVAITQLAQTTLRSVIGRMELDRTFEERDQINGLVVAALDEAAGNWGVKVLRYEIKDLTPPKEILHAMQAQITAEREKRAVIATSEGTAAGADQRRQRRARGGDRQVRRREAGGDQHRAGRGGGDARRSRKRTPRRSARSPRRSHRPADMQAVNLKVAEQYIAAFGQCSRGPTTR